MDMGCVAHVVPPLTDMTEVTSEPSDSGCEKETYDLIYPGIPFTKDDIEVMLEALLVLPEHVRRRIRFHSTGIPRERLERFLGKKSFLLDKLNDVFCIHGFMPYDDLEKLYHKMDFLLLSRYENLVNHANFPSKLPELMARGIIPIGNRVGDYHLCLTDDVNAFLFEKDDAHECANAILRAVSNPWKKIYAMKASAQKCAEKHWDYRHWSQRLSEFIQM